VSRPFFDRLAEPPRYLPLGARLFLLFGGVVSQIGWGLFAFGSIFGWTFAGNADVSSLVLFRTGVSQAQGVVTAARDTSASEGRVRVREVSYSFAGPGGSQRSGRSYITGTAPAPGESVTVEFVNAMPSVSRIQGMRQAMFGPAAVIVLIFPLIGLAIVLFSLRSGWKTGRLLSQGRLAAGKLKSKEGTNVTVNGRPVMKVTFEFVATDGQRHEASHSSTDTVALEDEASEQLLYLPDEPRSATLVDGLPGTIQASEDGGYRLERGRPVLALLLPAFAVALNALLAYLRFFR
jgi:hypothetical protein